MLENQYNLIMNEENYQFNSPNNHFEMHQAWQKKGFDEEENSLDLILSQ
jgi:hypothetical protein